MINAGVIFAPYNLFKKLCVECQSLIKSHFFGPDQIAINYIVYRNKFKELPHKYNFMTTITNHPFYVKKGVFYFEDGEKIPIVHNAGWKPCFRPIKGFGFGPNRNKFNKITSDTVKACLKAMSLTRK